VSEDEVLDLDADADLDTRVPTPDGRARGSRIVLVARRRFRLFGPWVPTREQRCTALLVKGWTDLGAGEDDQRRDVVWGVAP
jgi:hypothetical protein